MEIPVTFERSGKEYTAILKEIIGAGSIRYDLMKNGIYKGCLVKTEKGWQFTTQKDGVIEELGELFGGQVEKVVSLERS